MSNESRDKIAQELADKINSHCVRGGAFMTARAVDTIAISLSKYAQEVSGEMFNLMFSEALNAAHEFKISRGEFARTLRESFIIHKLEEKFEAMYKEKTGEKK